MDEPTRVTRAVPALARRAIVFGDVRFAVRGYAVDKFARSKIWTSAGWPARRAGSAQGRAEHVPSANIKKPESGFSCRVAERVGVDESDAPDSFAPTPDDDADPLSSRMEIRGGQSARAK